MDTMVSLNWIDWERADITQRNMCGRTLKQSDICIGIPKLPHIKKIITDKFGDRSSKIDSIEEQKFIKITHEHLRKRICNEAGQLLKEIYCALAKAAGLQSTGGGSFYFKNITNEILDNWDEKSFLKTFFVIRAAWDDNQEWILTAEEVVMKRLCLRYEDKFETTLKNFGCVASIISSEKVRKLRDFNRLLKKYCGRMIKVSGLEINKGEKRPACVFSKTDMIESFPGQIKLVDEKYHQDPVENNDINWEENGRINLLKLIGTVLPLDSFVKAKHIFSLSRYGFFAPKKTGDTDEEGNKKIQINKRTNQKRKITRKKLSISKNKAPKFSEDDVENKNHFAEQNGESVDDTLASNDPFFEQYKLSSSSDVADSESLVEDIDFESQTPVKASEKEDLSKENKTKQKLKEVQTVNTTKILQEMETFKQELLNKQEKEEHIRDLKLIEDVSKMLAELYHIIFRN